MRFIMAARWRAHFKSINHTRIIYLLVTLMNLKFAQRLPHSVTNFRFGSLGSGPITGTVEV